MKPGKLARTLLRLLAALAVAAAFVVLDWYPAVRDLGRLRRELSDLRRKIRDYDVMAAKFEFPDERENALLAGARAELRRALPPADRDDAWGEALLAQLRKRMDADGIRCATALSEPPETKLEYIKPDADDLHLLADWIHRRQAPAITEAFALAADPGRFPWREVLAGLDLPPGQRLARRPLAIVLAAPLPSLLNFINHVSWGDARLEIVRLHLEPGLPLSLAWLLLRGNYLVRGPSPWAVPEGAGGGDGLLVDPDSPLLWRRIDPAALSEGGATELPPAGAR